ncbi:hypothetical protein RGQ15_09555 [Paracoccus sp. MBLB3053]|uniref:Uncharacterized protein n=1 Tax=Paracoccus aurantius TaxID=3073814 RepID=A0ABU2HS05_9RHOB|nr:hypothetical protein [Paracoccus sp. MBLB3053]MDS9467812.1 hypothetical protein [Paracoccus sp. MBLB3053]
MQTETLELLLSRQTPEQRASMKTALALSVQDIERLAYGGQVQDDTRFKVEAWLLGHFVQRGDAEGWVYRPPNLPAPAKILMRPPSISVLPERYLPGTAAKGCVVSQAERQKPKSDQAPVAKKEPAPAGGGGFWRGSSLG